MDFLQPRRAQRGFRSPLLLPAGLGTAVQGQEGLHWPLFVILHQDTRLHLLFLTIRGRAGQGLLWEYPLRAAIMEAVIGTCTRVQSQERTMTPTTVPLTITPEAQALVAEIGMQRELEQMIEHTRQTVPRLRAIKVVFEPRYDTHDEPGILIEAVMEDPHRMDERIELDWIGWRVDTFPMEVSERFGMMTVHGEADGRESLPGRRPG